jgi:transposase InsO family protein
VLYLVDERKAKSGRLRKLDASDELRMLENEIKLKTTDPRLWKGRQLYRMFLLRFENEGRVFPIAERTFLSIVAKTRKNKTAMLLAQGKKAYSDGSQLLVSRINNVIGGELWESDGKRLSFPVQSPFYAHHDPSMRFLIYPILIMWLDVGSRTIVGWSFSTSENSNAVRSSLRMGLEQYGKPFKMRFDNSSAYKNVRHCPEEFSGLVRNKKNEKVITEAGKMLHQGNLGLYKNLGINYSFTIPGKPRGKGIESYFGTVISEFEKEQPIWTGNKPENRPAVLKITNKQLLRDYGDLIPTWAELHEAFAKFVIKHNNRPNEGLIAFDNSKLTPLQVYTEAKPRKLGKDEIRLYLQEPFVKKVMVRHSRVLVNGIYYTHPSFKSFEGCDLGFFYDELNINELGLCLLDGGCFLEKGRALKPGLQMNDDMSALKAVNHLEKQMKLAYIEVQGLDDKKKRQALLDMSSAELEAKQLLIQEGIKAKGELKLAKPKKGKAGRSLAVKEEVVTDSLEDFNLDEKIERVFGIKVEEEVEAKGKNNLGLSDKEMEELKKELKVVF